METSHHLSICKKEQFKSWIYFDRKKIELNIYVNDTSFILIPAPTTYSYLQIKGYPDRERDWAPCLCIIRNISDSL